MAHDDAGRALVVVQGSGGVPAREELHEVLAGYAGPAADAMRLEFAPPPAHLQRGRAAGRFRAKLWLPPEAVAAATARAAAGNGARAWRVDLLPVVVKKELRERRAAAAAAPSVSAAAAAVEELAGAPPGGRQTVRLNKIHLGDAHVEPLMRACAQHGVRSLSLRDNELTDAAATALVAGVRASPNLTQVVLEGNPMSAAAEGRVQGAVAVNVLLQRDQGGFDPLRSLNGRRLGDEGVSQVARTISGGLGDGPPLKVLGLARNDIGEAGAHALAEMLLEARGAAAGVELFEVYCNRAEAGWAKAFAPVIAASKTLRSLDLGKNGIEDAGCALLASALPGSALCELHLDYNAISDAGEESLTPVVPASSLHTLWLHGNPMSVDTQRRLQRKLRANRARLAPRPTQTEIAAALEERAARWSARERRAAPAAKAARQAKAAPDEVARAAVAHYVKWCPGHAEQVSGQAVLSCVVKEDAAGQLEVVAMGVGTRFVDELLVSVDEGDTERVRDSHAEVVARRGLRRYLVMQALLAAKDCGEASVLRPGGGDGRLELVDGERFYLFTSTAPCGAASTMSLAPGAVAAKGGGKSCSAWRPGARKSCTDKIMRWQAEGLQGKALGELVAPVKLAGIVIGRKWSARCQEVFPEAAATSVSLEGLVVNAQGARGDSDLCLSWTAGEAEVQTHDGKTGMRADTQPARVSTWYIQQELRALAEITR